MKLVGPKTNRDRLAIMMRKRALHSPTYDGSPTPMNKLVLAECTWHYSADNARMILTRDSGMHSSGWWKNPDYERCWHMSLSFSHVSPLIMLPEQYLPQDHKLARKWCDLIFGEAKRLLWIEPPFSDLGKKRDVYHYRLFCDPSWTPILPRGEVYSRDFTPSDWKSWSDVHGADNGDGEFGRAIERSGT